MIRQVSAVTRFEDAHTIAVPLQAPSAEQTHVVLAVVMGDRPAGLSVRDNLGAPRWRMANGDGGPTALWYRVGGPHGGVVEITIATAHQQLITGSAVAAEVAGVSPGAAVQALSDLLAEVAP